MPSTGSGAPTSRGGAATGAQGHPLGRRHHGRPARGSAGASPPRRLCTVGGRETPASRPPWSGPAGWWVGWGAIQPARPSGWQWQQKEGGPVDEAGERAASLQRTHAH
jgi:hypothetical protein